MWANKKNNTGFTIVETLIALSVSGVLFISVAALISGQVSRNQAKQAADTIEIFTRDVLNDVSTGYYPETGDNFGCTDTGASAPNVSSGGSTTRGANATCVFAGKKITFKNTEMQVDTVVALTRTQTLTNPATQLSTVDGLQETLKYPYGVRRSGPDEVYYVLNKLLSPTSAQEYSFVGGSQNVSVVDSANTSSSAGFVLCFDNGGNFAKLTIGARNGATATVQQGVSACTES